jgi:hypothetical protein
MRRLGQFTLLLALCACTKDPKESLLDTGWFDDTASYNPEFCPHRIAETLPQTDEGAWYWRRPPTLWAETTAQERYTAQILDSQGYVVSDSVSWVEEGNTFTVDLEQPLAASTDYVLRYSDCVEQVDVPFQTSALGTPLVGGPGELVGNTYNIDLIGADWVEPGAMGALLSLYFTTPILIGVQWADETTIDLLGAPGYEDSLGELQQYIWEPTWDFPLADFASSPYFSAVTDQVVFQFGSVDIPIHDFLFRATISADGAQLGGGELSGLGDTRHMGVLFDQPNDEMAVCDLAATLGVYCQPCPDGNETCMYMKALEVSGQLLPNVTLVEKE